MDDISVRPLYLLPEYPSLDEFLKHQRAEAAVNVHKMEAIISEHAVATITIHFDGSGDSGQVESVDAYNSAEQAISLDDKDEETITAWAYDKLETMEYDWVNNDGGYGDIVIDLRNGTVVCEYEQRISDTVSHILDMSEGCTETTNEAEPTRCHIFSTCLKAV